MRDSYQLVGHHMTEGVVGEEGKMELKDRFLQRRLRLLSSAIA